MRIKAISAILLLLIAGLASANYLGDVLSNKGMQSWLAFDEDITISFSYKVDDPAGARIIVRPYTNGYPTSNGGYQGSPIYPQGDGLGDQYCTVLSGETEVDQIKITMYTEDWNEQLLELFIPVEYHYSAKGINNLSFSHSSPSWIEYSQHLEITHDFATDEPGLLFTRPFSQGSTVTGVSASGGEVITPPFDTGSHFITFGSGPKDVDAIRFLLMNEDMTEVLWQAFVPVDYHWDAHGLSNLMFDWDDHTYLTHDEYIMGTFDYTTSDPNGVRIFCLGARDDEIVWTNMNPQGSVLMPAGSGNDTRTFRYLADTDINQACFRMTNDDQSEIYLDAFVPLDMHYRAHAVHHVTLTPGAPAILDYDEDVYTDFAYYTTGAHDLRIWNYGYAQGSLATVTSGSPLYPPVSGWGSNFFRYLGSDPILVDQVLFSIYDDVDEVFIEQSWYPALHFFGSSAVATSAPEETPAAVTKLLPNFPNPFNPKTTLSFNMSEAGDVQLGIFDVQGRLVRLLMDQHVAAGPHAIEWDGNNAQGEKMSSGVYFSKLMTKDDVQTRKMVLIK